MKGYLLCLILLFSVFFSGYFFSYHVNKDTGNTSIFYKSLESLKPYLKNTAYLSVQTSEPRIQHVLEARYILFPVQLQLLQKEEADTTLYILTKDDHSISIKGQIVWQNVDEHFRYYLVQKQ